ncbi:MAG: C10 family peptidase, partial [Bacteroidales bacterium]|nr:C10 family peptidase [Bacteroidales bacterium]
MEAAPIDTTTAKNIAIQYARLKEGGVTRTDQQLHIVCKVKSPFLAETPDEESRTPIGPKGGNPNASEEEKVCYYVINMDPAGFVIVSADNRTTPILAYSATDHFDADAMPDGMRALLNGFVEEIRALTPDDTALPAVQQKWQELASGTATPKSGNTVGPLIQTHWDQSSDDKLFPFFNSPRLDPLRATYNRFCPDDNSVDAPNRHAYAGCAAVALAQVIRYWEYPYVGKGSHEYEANFSSKGYGDYDTLRADFGSTYYNYELMPAQISIESPEGQINAVAQLLYHCGVATEMMYGPRGSNTPGPKMQTALTLYFRYPSGGERIFKANYDNETWSNIVKAELDAGRPILYEAADVSSSGKDNGHGFICDGYNSDDFFHFNWGWRGDYDNVWYPLSAMTPSIYTYNSKHGAYIGIGQGLEREKPTVATEMISCSSQSMTVKGILLRKGESNVTETGFVYGTSTGPTISNATKIPVARDYNQTFSYAITNVQPNTTYYVRAYATNEHGTMYGEEIIAFPSDHITIIFHKNDGTQETATQQFPPFGYHALSHDFTRPGHTLRVWNTASDGSGMSYSNGNRFYPIGEFGTSQIDLYAIWNNASCAVANVRSHETGSGSTITAVSDHQGNSYGVVQIGSQCWMSENLRCTTTPSGTNLFINPSFNMIQNPVMAYYFFDKPDNDKFGLLYTWYAACDATNPEANNSSTLQGICPEGWHLPTAGSDGDWGELTKTLKLPENS